MLFVLSRLVSALREGEQEREFLAFQPGGIVCIERTVPAAWKIRWMVVPDLVP